MQQDLEVERELFGGGPPRHDYGREEEEEDGSELRYRRIRQELAMSDNGDDASGVDAGVYFSSSRVNADRRSHAASWQDSQDLAAGPHNEHRRHPNLEGGYEHGVGNGGVPVRGGIAPDVHVQQMPGYDPVLLGQCLHPIAPVFTQASTMPGGWQEYSRSVLGGEPGPINPNAESLPSLVPARACVLNIPVGCFALGSNKFKEWQTPMHNSVRAASIAALLGLFAVPLSKGFLSGNHQEQAREAGSNDGGHRGTEKKSIKRVHTYMMPSNDNNRQNLPMVVVAYEEVYNRARTEVVAIRIWHFVFDPSHSTSYIARKLLEENGSEFDNAGAAHQQNNIRNKNLVTSSQQSRALLGFSLETAKLEQTAGMCYRHIMDISEYKNMLSSYAGQTDKSPGLHPIPDSSRVLPAGVYNTKFEEDHKLGCTHPLGLEWVFNAKRPDALRAGLVTLEGDEMDVHPDQVDPSSYFDLTSEDAHNFRVPEWVSNEKRCFFFQTNPFKLNIFDMILPRQIAGSVSPGKELLSLFRERFAPEIPLESSMLASHFENTITGQDQSIEKQVKALADSIISYDSIGCTPDVIKDASDARRAVLKGGIASYGQMDGEDHVVEPRQVLKEHAYHTTNIFNKLVQPWAQQQKRLLVEKELALRDGVANQEFRDVPISDSHFASVRKAKTKFQDRYNRIMEEMCKLHLAKMERAFNSRMDSESIPAGYRAVWSGLMKELESMPNKSANVAFALDYQMTDSDRTVFGHMTNWLGTYFEDGAQTHSCLHPCLHPCKSAVRY